MPRARIHDSAQHKQAAYRDRVRSSGGRFIKVRLNPDAAAVLAAWSAGYKQSGRNVTQSEMIERLILDARFSPPV
jgi:hypothetical protein